MRLTLTALLFVLAAPWLSAEPPNDHRAKSIRFVLDLYDADTGGFRSEPNGPVGLRGTVTATRSLKYLNAKPPEPTKTARFLLSCYDKESGGFAEPNADVNAMSTSIGILGATDLGLKPAQFPKALDYLRETAKGFEEVRLAAAAVEAWGPNDPPSDWDDWLVLIRQEDKRVAEDTAGLARLKASTAVSQLRLGDKLADPKQTLKILRSGQQPDGGWSRSAAQPSDLETSYRVMRAFVMLDEQPSDTAAVRKFLSNHAHPDGGYRLEPNGSAHLGATYFALIIGHWLDQLERK